MNEARLGQTSDGAAYFALDQYQGKGQRDKTWNSKPGENIILSVVKDCSGLHLNNQFQLSVAVALACFDFFSACGVHTHDGRGVGGGGVAVTVSLRISSASFRASLAPSQRY